MSTQDQEKEHARRQKEAAERTLQAQREREEGAQASHISTKLTHPAHVGKHPAEPHKDPAMEGLKTDLGVVTGVPVDEKVKTAPQNTEGKGTTDEVVTNPDVGAERLGQPLNEAQRTAAAARGEEEDDGAAGRVGRSGGTRHKAKGHGGKKK